MAPKSLREALLGASALCDCPLSSGPRHPASSTSSRDMTSMSGTAGLGHGIANRILFAAIARF